MSKIKYYYNAESCRYERIQTSSWDIVFNLFGFFVVSFIIGLSIFFITDYYFESPSKADLRKENEELTLYYDLLEKEVAEIGEVLGSLENRDDNIYRVIYGVDPIPPEIRGAGIGGANRYRNLLEKGLDSEALILKNMQRIDKIRKKMYIQTKSYDEIIDLATNREDFLASLPAIQPVANKELKKIASGYGIRIDPIQKIKKMHYGVDFSIKKGIEVYATGDGVVKLTRTSFNGYGKQIQVDHGFGYITKYAHLSEFLVKKGEKVKRGQPIAYSGNTGKSTAPHLHYEVIINGRYKNPIHYFYKDVSDKEYAEILKLSSIENQALGSY